MSEMVLRPLTPQKLMGLSRISDGFKNVGFLPKILLMFSLCPEDWLAGILCRSCYIPSFHCLLLCLGGSPKVSIGVVDGTM